jgi:hypothetical protein
MPVYDEKLDANKNPMRDRDGKVIAEIVSFEFKGTVSVFHLLGWGENEEDAKAMAMESLTYEKSNRDAVERAYEQSNRNVAACARLLDIREHRAHRLLVKFGLKKAA